MKNAGGATEPAVKRGADFKVSILKSANVNYRWSVRKSSS